MFAHLAFSASAQEERGLTRDGNKLFTKGKYSDAEAAYKKALEKKNNFPEAIFNLGDAIYKQKRYDDAIAQFELAAKTFKDPKQKAQAYHNLGNAQLDKEEYEKAVDAYKQALKLNPADRDTRYNLAYANAKLRKEQQQNQQNKNNKNNKDNKDNKDQNKDNKDQDKKDQQGKGDKDKKDNKDQKDKDQQGKGDKDQKKPGEQPKLTKEQAEKLLEALKAEEQKAQDKMQKKAAKPADVQIEKDW
ncbi:MAG: tetratricopeptide repeat protein [Bacteroidetes bacterium]|nr:tetratricopeptide repeat protein [Bacteroidota bacterium]